MPPFTSYFLNSIASEPFVSFLTLGEDNPQRKNPDFHALFKEHYAARPAIYGLLRGFVKPRGPGPPFSKPIAHFCNSDDTLRPISSKYFELADRESLKRIAARLLHHMHFSLAYFFDFLYAVRILA